MGILHMDEVPGSKPGRSIFFLALGNTSHPPCLFSLIFVRKENSKIYHVLERVEGLNFLNFFHSRLQSLIFTGIQSETPESTFSAMFAGHTVLSHIRFYVAELVTVLDLIQNGYYVYR